MAGGMAAVAMGLAVTAFGALVVGQSEPPPVSPAPAPTAMVMAAVRPATIAPAPIPASAPAESPFVVKRVLSIDGPFRHGDYVWDEAGAPAGPLVITVDIGAQTLSVFRGGYEIGAAVILFGADDKPTPLGAFKITQKKKDHVSNLYGAPMPFMMRLTNDGVAIHGSNVERDSATNGCIGVPTEFAKLLFGQAKLGDRVIITNGKMIDVGERIVQAPPEYRTPDA